MGDLEHLIAQAYALGASDLHLETGTPTMVRVRGELQALGGAVGGDAVAQLARRLLGPDGWAEFGARGSADLSEALCGVRCRINFYRTFRGVAAAVRLLAPAIKDLRACNLHKDFRKLLDASSGLIIIAGPTGSGKSTTLAALIEEINATRARHVVTLESPIEYLFANRQSYIRQREVPTHTPTFEQGIMDALRENPDVLVISEMRTPEVMRLTLNAAETGHLVLATLHAASCAEALSRLCMSFPADIQPSVRAQLADCLVAVCCQRLEFLPAFGLRVPRCELLLPTSGAKGTLRAGNLSQLANVLQAGGEEGMWTFDRYQRWMDQVTDWVRPPAAVASRSHAESTPARSVASRAIDGAGAASDAAVAAGALQAGAVRTGNANIGAGKGGAAAARVARRSQPAADDVIDVPAEELDLASLAELAKKVVDRD